MAEINLLDVLPNTLRPLAERATADEKDRAFHWRLGREYFDGTRAQGYGGYKFDGRWKPLVHRLAEYYDLGPGSRVLDIGCAKGFLLTTFLDEIPGIKVAGLDISEYALTEAPERVRPYLCLGNAKEIPFRSNYFDLVFSKDTLHNILTKDECVQALSEIERVSKGNKFIRVGAYRNEHERVLLDNWAVVATTYLPPEEWVELFKCSGYTGDYTWFTP